MANAETSIYNIRTSETMHSQPVNEAFDILTPLLWTHSPQLYETLMNPHASIVQCIAQACRFHLRHRLFIMHPAEPVRMYPCASHCS